MTRMDRPIFISLVVVGAVQTVENIFKKKGENVLRDFGLWITCGRRTAHLS